LDSGGAAGGDGCGYEDHQDDECGGGGEGDGIVDGDAVELAAEVAREDADRWERDDGSDGGNENHLAEHGNDDAAARRSESEADADLAGALLSGVGKHAVEADGRQYEARMEKLTARTARACSPEETMAVWASMVRRPSTTRVGSRS